MLGDEARCTSLDVCPRTVALDTVPIMKVHPAIPAAMVTIAAMAES